MNSIRVTELAREVPASLRYNTKRRTLEIMPIITILRQKFTSSVE